MGEPAQDKPSAIGEAAVFVPKQISVDTFVPQSQATVDKAVDFLE